MCCCFAFGFDVDLVLFCDCLGGLCCFVVDVAFSGLCLLSCCVFCLLLC